ncbi:HEAT repeat domain-containing protein [Methanogenium sp. S4BF]|uniref:HEAT repeat domain-containing protein n=1 Tax=Methanogenium sp. S4BF TaxID=1789226 RepID=UPI002417ACB1|nr:HEAT repeat domain-containing protein [Methanogenium sp. S4BF]WFN35520.1 HEAT repeat domain-containing protein [Methanogenium sp. S4BF]
MIPEMPVGTLIADLLSEDDTLRISAESTLKDLSPEAVLPEISALLRSHEKRIRNRGMELFCCMGCVSVPSLSVLLSDDEWTVRYRAAESLGIIGGDAACALLVPVLQDERDHVRYMAAKGLGLSAYIQSADAVACLLNDENEFVRASAARALGLMNLAAYAPAIECALACEEYEKTRDVMAEALVCLGRTR